MSITWPMLWSKMHPQKEPTPPEPPVVEKPQDPRVAQIFQWIVEKPEDWKLKFKYDKMFQRGEGEKSITVTVGSHGDGLGGSSYASIYLGTLCVMYTTNEQAYKLHSLWKELSHKKEKEAIDKLFPLPLYPKPTKRKK